MEYKYKAFISYNHNERDSRVAQALHKRIETYVIPRNLRKNGKKKPGRVFRDQEELSVSSDLNQHIRDALDESEFLIVICSPGAMGSKWVKKEISLFLEHHEQAKVLTVLTDGSSEEIYKSLFRNMPEPLSLDLVGVPDKKIERKLKERFPKIGAPLLGCEHNDLVMRENKRQHRIIRGWLAGITSVAAVIIGILLWSNWQIEEKNEALEQMNQEILLRESELLTQNSVRALAEGDQNTAIRDAVNALPDAEHPRPYYAPAEQALHNALDIFNMKSYDVVLRDTVLEQNSVVEDLCFSTDGTKVFAAGENGSVNCYDISSGGLLWSRQIGMITEIILCESQGSIIVYGDGGVMSLSLDTGESLWNVDVMGGYVHSKLSDDETALVCMSGEGKRVMLTCISPADGTILRTIPVSSKNMYYGRYLTNVCDFSSDGRYFAGCFQNSGSGGFEYLTVFYLDMETGKVHVLPSLSYRGSMRPCSVEFTDQDTTLTVIHYEYNNSFFYRVEKIRISDGKHLWKTDTPEQDFDYYVFRWGFADWLHGEEYLLLGIQHQLYALDMETGDLLDTEYLPSRLQRLQKLDDDFFALVLEDGTYRIGSVSAGDLRLQENVSAAYDQSSMMNLGPNLNVWLGNRGYLRAGDADGQALSVISSDHNGPCYAAFIPRDNDWQIVVRQATVFEPPLEKKSLYAYDSSGSNFFEAGFCGADMFYLKEQKYEGETMFYDRRTLEQIYPEPGSIRLPAYFSEGRVLENGENGILLADDSILTLTVMDFGFRLRHNNGPLFEVKYPENVGAYLAETYLLPVSVGRNGYVLAELGLGAAEFGLDPYYLYDIHTQKWYSIPCREADTEETYTCLGVTKPTLTVMDQNGTLRIYDIPTGKEIRCIDTELQTYNIRNIQWIMDDRYLLAQDEDTLRFYFLDGVTGEVLLRYTAKTDQLVYMPQFVSDPQRDRFFIWADIGVCIDTKNWAVLTEIPGMELYDPVTGMIFYQDPTTVTAYFEEFICAISFPSTEELVAIGRAYLGQ